MTVRLPKRQHPGVKLVYVKSESRPGVEYTVQHIRRGRQDRWYCSCPQFTFRCLARRCHCKHIRFARWQQKTNRLLGQR